MRLIIEARVEDPDTRCVTAAAVTLAVDERRTGSLVELGLTPPEGRDLWPRPSRHWCRNKLAVG